MSGGAQQEGMTLEDVMAVVKSDHIVNDDVSRQKHYTSGGIQPIQVMEENFTHEEMRGFLRGNVIKYVMRYLEKDGTRDLKKAQVYLAWLTELENDQPLTIPE